MAKVGFEVGVMRRCWNQLSKLDRHARARVLLWMVRKHQNVGVEIDLRSLEREAVEPRD